MENSQKEGDTTEASRDEDPFDDISSATQENEEGNTSQGGSVPAMSKTGLRNVATLLSGVDDSYVADTQDSVLSARTKSAVVKTSGLGAPVVPDSQKSNQGDDDDDFMITSSLKREFSQDLAEDDFESPPLKSGPPSPPASLGVSASELQEVLEWFVDGKATYITGKGDAPVVRETLIALVNKVRPSINWHRVDLHEDVREAVVVFSIKPKPNLAEGGEPSMWLAAFCDRYTAQPKVSRMTKDRDSIERMLQVLQQQGLNFFFKHYITVPAHTCGIHMSAKEVYNVYGGEIERRMNAPEFFSPTVMCKFLKRDTRHNNHLSEIQKLLDIDDKRPEEGYNPLRYNCFSHICEAEAVRMTSDFASILHQVPPTVVNKKLKTLGEAIAFYCSYYQTPGTVFDILTHGVGPGVLNALMRHLLEFLGAQTELPLDHSLKQGKKVKLMEEMLRKMNLVLNAIPDSDTHVSADVKGRAKKGQGAMRRKDGQDFDDGKEDGKEDKSESSGVEVLDEDADEEDSEGDFVMGDDKKPKPKTKKTKRLHPLGYTVGDSENEEEMSLKESEQLLEDAKKKAAKKQKAVDANKLKILDLQVEIEEKKKRLNSLREKKKKDGGKDKPIQQNREKGESSNVSAKRVRRRSSERRDSNPPDSTTATGNDYMEVDEDGDEVRTDFAAGTQFVDPFDEESLSAKASRKQIQIRKACIELAEAYHVRKKDSSEPVKAHFDQMRTNFTLACRKERGPGAVVFECRDGFEGVIEQAIRNGYVRFDINVSIEKAFRKKQQEDGEVVQFQVTVFEYWTPIVVKTDPDDEDFIEFLSYSAPTGEERPVPIKKEKDDDDDGNPAKVKSEKLDDDSGRKNPDGEEGKEKNTDEHPGKDKDNEGNPSESTEGNVAGGSVVGGGAGFTAEELKKKFESLPTNAKDPKPKDGKSHSTEQSDKSRKTRETKVSCYTSGTVDLSAGRELRSSKKSK